MSRTLLTLLSITLLASPCYLAAQSQDTTAPAITDVTVDQSSIDTSSADETVVATLTLTDDLSGINRAYMTCRSPSGQVASGNGALTSGSPTSGTWAASTVFPRYSEHGSWTCVIDLVDAVLNDLHQTDLSGFTFTGTISNGP